MIFAGILAGGKGERFNNDVPKQFVLINGKPIIYYPLKTFHSIDKIKKIVISCYPDYMDYIRSLVVSLSWDDKMVVIEGGETRYGSLFNIIEYIKSIGYSTSDKILLHEAARPLVDINIIMDHIYNLNNCDATNTLYRAVDTMMISTDGKYVEAVPSKKTIYHGQTPQGYDLEKLTYVLDNEVTHEDLKNEEDLCGIFIRGNRKVKIVKGSERLFKITYSKDINLLSIYLDEQNPN